jgi:hypothetical protein
MSHCFFIYRKDEEIMSQIDQSPVVQAMQEFQTPLTDEDKQYLVERRARALSLERSELEGAFERGIAIGKAKAIAEAKAKALKAMLASDISEAQAKIILGM